MKKNKSNKKSATHAKRGAVGKQANSRTQSKRTGSTKSKRSK